MTTPSPDPVFRSGRREASIVFLVWVVALAYSVSYCYAFGYNQPPEKLRFAFGIPTWVLWGVVAPWLACVLFSGWFSFFFIEDDPLPEEAELDA